MNSGPNYASMSYCERSTACGNLQCGHRLTGVVDEVLVRGGTSPIYHGETKRTAARHPAEDGRRSETMEEKRDDAKIWMFHFIGKGE